MPCTLNKGQQAVHDQLTDGTFCSAVVVAGPGTGKSTVSRGLVEHYATRPEVVIIMAATTGTAARQLADSAIGSKRLPATTIHSLVMGLDSEGELNAAHPVMAALMVRTCKPRAIVVVVDEVMMCDIMPFVTLTQYMAQLKWAFSRAQVQYVLLGDYRQTAAVGISFMSWKGLEAFFTTHNFRFLSLTVSERFKGCPEMTRIATALARRDPSFALMLRPFAISAARPAHLPGCGNLVLAYTQATCAAHNAHAFNYARNCGAPCIVLVDGRTGEAAAELVVGGRVIMTRNTKSREGGVLYVNGDMGSVEAATGNDATTQGLLDTYGSGRIKFLAVNPRLELTVCLDRNRDVPGEVESTTVTPRTTMEPNDMGVKIKAYSVDLLAGAAITIHRSQGMTFPKERRVTIDLNHLPEEGGLNLATVALTRTVCVDHLRIVAWGSGGPGGERDDVETACMLCDAPVQKGVNRYLDIVQRVTNRKRPFPT